MRKSFLLLIAMVAANCSFGQTISFTLTTAPCNNDGVLTANITGLTPPLTVQWHTYGTTGTTITHTATTLSDALTSYSGGPVNVSVSSASGSAYNYYVGAPPFTYSVTATPATCPTPGTATATVSGGTSPYTYNWFDPATAASVSTSNPASLPSGAYGVTITDAAGCQYGSLVSMDSVYIYETSPIAVATSTTPANCTNGTATVTSTTGATAPVSYLWSTGAVSSGISGLTTGSYVVTVTDALGCTGTSYAYVPQAITINAPITPTPATCLASDGAVATFPTGGVPPYTYVWSNGATTSSQTGLTAGYYGVTVTDANGCIGHGTTSVGTSTPITVTYTATPSSCTSPTGTATITPTGGTTPYSILWYTSPTSTSTSISSKPAGAYGFKVTDAMGCVRTGMATIDPEHILSAAFGATAATCTLSNGGLHVYPAGGSTPYTYSWTTGGTTSSISSVPAGSYGVSITDAAGCSITKYHTVPVFSPIGVGVTSTPASCIFTSDGSLSATVYGGTTPYTYSWTGGSTTSTATGLSTGHYYLGVTDAAGCHFHNMYNVGYNPANTSCYCTITGTIYADANGNCVQDAGEAGIPNIQVYCSGRGYTYTNASGQYHFIVPSGSYTVTETVLAYYPLSACQANNIPVTVTAGTGCVTTVNFANSVSTIHDMRISTWNYNYPVPGHSYSQVTLISNTGTVTESNILAGYYSDGQMFAPSFVPSGVFVGSPYWYNTSGGFPTLTPGGTQTFHTTYSVPTYLPLGTSLLFKDTVAWQAPISTWLTDYSPANNVNYFTTNVVSSYDPNFKEVQPKGTGPTGLIATTDSVLEYMVHFQNTGNYKAENIVVVDTLDNDLDWTSLQPIYMSAPCQVTLTQSGSYKIATFTFNNIDLPAQADDDLRSNGMFTYTIKQNHGLAAGTEIRNKAAIYFDYNAPVITNETLNTIAPSTGVTDLDHTQVTGADQFVVYPNPARESFSVLINSTADGSAKLTVSDIAGRTLLSKDVTMHKGGQTIEVNPGQLAPGLYVVSLNENGKVHTQKLTIVK